MRVSWFAIVRDSDGALISHESSDAKEKLTDAELLARGLVRVPIPEQLPANKVWNKLTRQQENAPVPIVSPEETLRLALIALPPDVVNSTMINIFKAQQLLLKKVKFL